MDALHQELLRNAPPKIVQAYAIMEPELARPKNMQERCELISKYWAGVGFVRTPEQIFNYSSTGELYNVFAWYEEALLFNTLEGMKGEE